MKSVLILSIMFLYLAPSCQAQQTGKSDRLLPTLSDVTRVETFLSSDAMKGRKTFSPEIEKVSDFIETKFKEAGLKPFFPAGYREEFFLNTSSVRSARLTLNSTQIPDSLFMLLSGIHTINLHSLDSFSVVPISKDLSPAKRRSLISKYLQSVKMLESNILLVLDPSLQAWFKKVKLNNFPTLVNNQKTVLLVIAAELPDQIDLKAVIDLKRQPLNNVAAILPGTEKPDEYVVFSAHYDHLGTGSNAAAMRQPEPGKDSIYNGANDDASGTTAVLELAKYYSARHLNKRSIVFVTFTAEEIGEYGSHYFSANIDNKKVIAMFNIEMIGTASKWGINSAYITGYERSDFGKILQKNLAGSAFQFYPDPYPAQNLFYRSDNAQLALKGVPAHTISTSKMDDEHNYHTPQDEIGTLDLGNMTRIIDAIALSSEGIISGQDTPSRVTIE